MGYIASAGPTGRVLFNASLKKTVSNLVLVRDHIGERNQYINSHSKAISLKVGKNSLACLWERLPALVIGTL